MSKEILDTPVDSLNLSVRATNVLANAGIKTVSDFVLCDPHKLRIAPNAGEKTIYEIGSAIKRLLTIEDAINEVIMSSNNTQDDNSKISKSNATFEELLKISFDEELLNTPIDELYLPVRTFNSLKRVGLKTVKDIIDYGFNTLLKKTKLGRKSIDNIKMLF